MSEFRVREKPVVAQNAVIGVASMMATPNRRTCRRIFRSTCQTVSSGQPPNLGDGSPMLDGHARLRAAEHGWVCACPLG